MAILRKKGLFESSRVLYLSTSVISPNPAQPRTYFDPQGIRELASSIESHGILQPLSVRKVPSGYELISGERRLRAAQLLGLATVPCIPIWVDEEGSSLLALVENIQRRDLNFLEESLAISRLIATHNLSQEETAKRLGKSQSAIANKLRILRLPDYILEALQSHGLTERHARALLRLEDNPQALEACAQHAIEHKLTVALTEAYVDKLLAPVPRRSAKPTYIIKDVRLFLNTVTKGLNLMKHAGVDANCNQEETEESILLTIKIPKQLRC